jgi:hypothetical protein
VEKFKQLAQKFVGPTHVSQRTDDKPGHLLAKLKDDPGALVLKVDCQLFHRAIQAFSLRFIIGCFGL